MIRNLLALTGLIALALLSAATLQAQGYFDDYYDDHEPPPREAVSTAGLDLASPAGVYELETRINAAIDRVCPDDRTRSLKRMQSTRECREDAVASVRPQVDRVVAAAEAREFHAYRPPGRWRHDGPPPRDRYAARAPLPPHGERLAPPPTAAAPPVVAAPAPPPPGGRLVRRTVTTTTVTTTESPATLASPPATRIEKTVVIDTAGPPAKRGWKAKAKRADRAPAFARRPAVPHSWLPPAAWAASDRATLRAFRTGKLARWNLTDRNGIARKGYVTVGAKRWLGGCPCRNVQTVKYHGHKQIVVASGMRCMAGKRLVNRTV